MGSGTVVLEQEEKRKSKRWLFVAMTVALLGFGCAYAVTDGFLRNPFKVTDPTSPKFDVSELRLVDYKDEQSLNAALESLLIKGMSKADVDALLVGKARAYSTLDRHFTTELESTVYYRKGRDTKTGRGPNGYVVCYYSPDKEWNEKAAFLSVPGWAVWVHFDLNDTLVRHEVIRIDFKVNYTQKHLLSENVKNMERLGR